MFSLTQNLHRLSMRLRDQELIPYALESDIRNAIILMMPKQQAKRP
jgi:hypothetical protein